VNIANSFSQFDTLVSEGVLTRESLQEATREAASRQVPVSTVLHYELGVSRTALLSALAEYYQCAAIEYDERLPVPPELLTNLKGDRLLEVGWFPVLKNSDGSVVIAASDPYAPSLEAEVEKYLGPGSYEFRVALPEDIEWFIQDLLHAKVGELIGTERTGLAYWRNTMAQWRTLLACYRTDMAKGRTALALTRCGLSFVTIAFTLNRSKFYHVHISLFVSLIVVGIALSVAWLPDYFLVRRSRLRPPQFQTLAEVTAATLLFLENYHFLDGVVTSKVQTKETMLARLGDHLADYCTILYPSPLSRERTHLARERNVLAGQRTIAACYRTLYARARTGLAFTRTGVAFTSIGIGLITHFGFGLSTLFDGMLIVVGFFMVVDGLLWYMPVRKEQHELPRTRSAVLAGR